VPDDVVGVHELIDAPVGRDATTVVEQQLARRAGLAGVAQQPRQAQPVGGHRDTGAGQPVDSLKVVLAQDEGATAGIAVAEACRYQLYGLHHSPPQVEEV
jgi:hypothetical protein